MGNIGTGFASVKSNLFLGHSEAHWANLGHEDVGAVLGEQHPKICVVDLQGEVCFFWGHLGI